MTSYEISKNCYAKKQFKINGEKKDVDLGNNSNEFIEQSKKLKFVNDAL